MQILALDKDVEAFVVYVISLSLNLMPIYPAQKAQIALLVIEKVQIPSKYSDFLDIFLKEKALILSEIIDLNQHAIKLQKDDQRKTAFHTRYSHFEYQTMPFGLSNVPASFQGYINKILAKKLDIFVIVYQNDILIYIKDLGQGHVKLVSVNFIRIKFVFWAMSCRPRQLGWKINKLKRWKIGLNQRQ